MGWALLGAGLLLALYTLLRHGLRRLPPPRARTALGGRTAIVTGGSGGIGAATALELARCGARVVLAARSVPRGEAAARRIRTRSPRAPCSPPHPGPDPAPTAPPPPAPTPGRVPPPRLSPTPALPQAALCPQETGNAEVRFMQLDLASLRSVRAFASAFLRQEPHLHLLINNAGVSAGGTTEDGFSLSFQVNHLGHFLLTQLLLERLQSCAPSRVVIVASRAHCAGRLHPDALGRPPPGPLSTFQDYCDSKLANVLHARELATRLQGTQVTCYAVHPGRDPALRPGAGDGGTGRARRQHSREVCFAWGVPLRGASSAWRELCVEQRQAARHAFCTVQPLHREFLHVEHPLARSVLCMASPFAQSIPLHGASVCTEKATAELPVQRPPWRGHFHFSQQSNRLPHGPFPAGSRAATRPLPLAPGFVNTELFRHTPLWLKPLFLPLVWLFFRDAAEGARTSLHCATQEGLERFSGRYFADCRLQEPWPPARDDRLARALWEASERLVGLGGTGGSPSPAPTDFGQ
ncbi:hypothetical protein QYF61_009100 [Mycteria americana]|uniref:Dehydrogenase/reductase SDR family member 13 n=1 Tax=Mycteria americana TaxID=33587 RepID=A0AAN7RYH9_MYCAM|nr:hypothetical protein QYF61_009100 [Mycteria americana]